MMSKTESVEFNAVAKVEKFKKDERQNKENSDFICRVCGSKEFKEISKSDKIHSLEGGEWKACRVCFGYSAIFEDSEKFLNG